MPTGLIKLIKKDVDLVPLQLGIECKPNRYLNYLNNWINLDAELKDISNVTIIFPFLSRRFEFTYKNNTKESFFFNDEYKNHVCLLSFEGKGSYYLKENKENNHFYQIDTLFLDNGLKKFYLSHDLSHLKNKVKLSYGLEYNYNNDDPTLIFGLYNKNDINYLKEAKRYAVLWGGSDIMINSKYRSEAIEIIKNSNCINYAMSKKIFNKLKELGITNIEKVTISFCWNDLHYKIRTRNYSKKQNIYIYDGLDKSAKKKIIYNQEIVDNIINELGDNFNYYRSSDGYREDIINLYKDSFVSLRLTEYDGNANSAQECGMLGIPVISNQSMNHCISWKNKDEIISKIRYIYDKNIKLYWEKDGINLLFISNDLPGKGGGATFTGHLKDYLMERGFNIWEIYLVHSENNETELDGKRYIIKFNHKKKLDFTEWISLATNINKDFRDFVRKGFKIILRSSVSIELNVLNKYDVIFLSPGIYKNDLEGEYEMKYINNSNLKTSSLFETYANSVLTQRIFYKFGMNEVGLLEINLLQMKEMKEYNERDIDFIFVVSNIDRKIKNAKLFFELAKRIDKKFVLISADNIKIGIPKVEIAINPENLNSYYKRAKCLINCSYFDSMSNVVLEAINNGCHILVSEQNGIVDYVGDMRPKFVVEGYDIRVWEERMLDVLRGWGEMLDDRKRLLDILRRKSWEVEIKLLELLCRK